MSVLSTRALASGFAVHDKIPWRKTARQ